MPPHLRPLGAAPTFRHCRATPQDARLVGGSLVRMGPLRGQTTPSSQQECRTTPSGGGAHGGIGSGYSPPLPPGATADSRVSRMPPPTPAERETCGGRRPESIDQMEVDPVQGITLQEDNPSRRERRRAGAGRGDHQPNSGNAPERGFDGAAPRLGSSTSPGTTAGEGQRATNSTPAEGLISSRTRARTR